MGRVAAAHPYATIFFVHYLAACLDYVKELEKRAHPAALRPAAGAARVSCKLLARPLSVRISPRRAHHPLPHAKGLPLASPCGSFRGSCQQARNGTVTLRIRTASRRIKDLRQVVGPRLVIGAYR